MHVSIQVYSVTGTKWNQQVYITRIQVMKVCSYFFLYPSEPASIPSRDPEAQQALDRATQGPHVIFSLLKITRYLGWEAVCTHAWRERSHTPPKTPVEGAIPGIQETRLCTYLRPYLYVKVYFNIIIYYTLQREPQNKETGVRTTQDRMEKVRRELHLPVR